MLSSSMPHYTGKAVTDRARALAPGRRICGSESTATSKQPRLALAACVLALACVSACQRDGNSYRVVDSDFMEFEDLFSRVDTVRFDASVLIGSMTFVDVSDRGEFLITDDQMKTFHVFAASGEHVRSFTASACNPEDHGFLQSARFLEDGSMVAATSSGTYAFNADGSCKKRLLEIPPMRPSFCEWRGHTYFLNTSLSPPRIYAYSMESGIVREHDLRAPKFPRLTATKLGQVGREIACFNQGVLYRYPESSDGEPLMPGDDPVMHRPTFYRAPQREMLITDDIGARIDNLRQLAREATYSYGIFELDESHRLVAFETTPDRSLNIVNMETQTSVSTITDLRLKLAKHGLLYVGGDNEPLPSGEVGNQTLETWRFRPFESSHAEVAR